MVMVRAELTAVVPRADPTGAARWAEPDDRRNTGAHRRGNGVGRQPVDDDLKNRVRIASSEVFTAPRSVGQ